MTLSRDTFYDLFSTGLSANGDALQAYCTRDISDRFYALTEEMLRVNSFMNVTAITEPADIIIKHYADCARIAPLLPAGAHLCDVGTGGGFPSLPAAILRPDVTITAVDSTAKKLNYVAQTARLLGLDNLTTKAARAEELGKQPEFREAFDIVTARAVARMNVLCEWCLPLVKKDGHFLAMKGRDGAAEYEKAKNAIDILGGITISCDSFLLRDPFSGGSADNDAMARTLILVKKRQFTPKQYPRGNAQISKKPL